MLWSLFVLTSQGIVQVCGEIKRQVILNVSSSSPKNLRSNWIAVTWSSELVQGVSQNILFLSKTPELNSIILNILDKIRPRP